MIAKHLDSYARYGALLAIAIEWLALFYFYGMNPSFFSGEYPLSYFATIPETRFIFSLCYTLAALSFWVFVKYHLRKYYRTPVKIFTLSMLGFAAVAILPFSFDNPITSAIHNLLALFFSATFIVGMLMMSQSNTDNQVRLVSGVAAVIGAILLLLFLSSSADSQLTLFFEAGSGVVCQLWMVWISLHAFKK